MISKRWMAVAFNILIRMGHNNRRHFFLVECNGGMNKDLNNNYNMYSYIFGIKFILFLIRKTINFKKSIKTVTYHFIHIFYKF